MKMFTLDTTQAKPDLDLAKYENLFVGVELEFEGVNATRAKSLLGFEGKLGKTQGINQKRVEKQIYGGGSITVDVDTNLYKEAGYVAQIYNDPSVGTEVVLRAVPRKKIYVIEKIHKTLKNAGANFWARGHGGMHLTFMIDPHKEHSEWDPIVIQNLIQIVRRYYKDFVEMYPGGERTTRPTEYRAIPTIENRNTCRTSHYTALSTRVDSRGKIWSFEFRIPDGTNETEMIKPQIQFYMALIRQAAIISKFGLLGFDNQTWEKMQRYYQDHYYNNITGVEGGVPPELKRLLRPSLEYYGWFDRREVSEDYQTKQKIMALVVEGKKANEIRKELGLNLYRFRQLMGLNK